MENVDTKLKPSPAGLNAEQARGEIVPPTGIEPATFGTGNRCSNPLSDGDIAGKIPNDVILAHGVVGD